MQTEEWGADWDEIQPRVMYRMHDEVSPDTPFRYVYLRHMHPSKHEYGLFYLASFRHAPLTAKSHDAGYVYYFGPDMTEREMLAEIRVLRDLLRVEGLWVGNRRTQVIRKQEW